MVTVVNDNIAPKDRDIAMVFQNYALYPHMTVYDNMAFGLETCVNIKKTISTNVYKKLLLVLGLTEFLDRKPADLSGGQRQRVAMGRAIVRDAKVFLDGRTSVKLGCETSCDPCVLKLLKSTRNIGATTIYVTHDQTEAMTLG